MSAPLLSAISLTSTVSKSMSRQLILRSTRPTIYLGAFRPPGTSRKVTTPPPQGQSSTDKAPLRPEGSNTLIILSALGALGGLYYYYTRGQPGIDRETERHKEEERRRKVRETEDAGKSMVENIAAQGRRDYDQAKTKVQQVAGATRTRATEAGTDLADRARQSTHEVHAKLDELKDTAERKMSDVRDRSEMKLEEGEEEVARQARDAKNKARGWFGWGSSK